MLGALTRVSEVGQLENANECKELGHGRLLVVGEIRFDRIGILAVQC